MASLDKILRAQRREARMTEYEHPYVVWTRPEPREPEKPYRVEYFVGAWMPWAHYESLRKAKVAAMVVPYPDVRVIDERGSF